MSSVPFNKVLFMYFAVLLLLLVWGNQLALVIIMAIGSVAIIVLSPKELRWLLLIVGMVAGVTATLIALASH